MSPNFKVYNNKDNTYNIFLIEKKFENNQFIYILSKYNLNNTKSLTLDTCEFHGRNVLTYIRNEKFNNLQHVSFKNTIAIDGDDNKLVCLFAILTNRKSISTLEISNYIMIDTIFTTGLWQTMVSDHLKILIFANNTIDGSCAGHIKDAINARNTKLSELHLSNNTYTGYADVFISLMLRRATKIEHIILEEPSELMIENTLYNSGFTGITIKTSSLHSIDVGDNIAKHISNLLKKSGCVLDTLIIKNYPMSIYGCRKVLHELKNNHSLTHIDLSGTSNTCEELIHITKNKCLKHLILPCCGLNTSICSNLLSCIKNGLIELDISHNFIGTKSAKNLSILISHNESHIQILKIRDCRLDDKDLTQIIQSIDSKKTMITLDISDNCFGVSTILAISHLLVSNIFMQELSMINSNHMNSRNVNIFTAYKDLYKCINENNFNLVLLECNFKIFEKLMIRNRQLNNMISSEDENILNNIVDDLHIDDHKDSILGNKRHVNIDHEDIIIVDDDNETFYEMNIDNEYILSNTLKKTRLI